MTSRVSIIVAVADNGVIGFDKALPWRLRSDLRHFKRLTMGHHLIIGRRTWESVNVVLPGRTMVVVTRRPGEQRPGLHFVPSICAGLDIAAGDDEVFIGGGGGIYREALAIADRLYITRVHAAPEGDAWFPGFDEAAWLRISWEAVDADEHNEHPHTFEVWDRR